MNQPLHKPLRFHATAPLKCAYPDLVIVLAAVVSQHFKIRPMDLYIFEPAAPGTIHLRVNGYQFGSQDSEEVSFTLPPLPGHLLATVWCKIDEQEDEYAAVFMFPSEY